MERRAKRQLTGWNSEDGLWQPGVCLWVRCWWAPDRIVALCDMGRTYHLADEVEIQRLLEMQMLLYVGEGDSREVDAVAGWLPDSTQWLSGMTLYRQRRGSHIKLAVTSLRQLQISTCQSGHQGRFSPSASSWTHARHYLHYLEELARTASRLTSLALIFSNIAVTMTTSMVPFWRNAKRNFRLAMQSLGAQVPASASSRIPGIPVERLWKLMKKPLVPRCTDGSLRQCHTAGRFVSTFEACRCEQLPLSCGDGFVSGAWQTRCNRCNQRISWKDEQTYFDVLQHLKKLVGYLKHTGNVGVKLTYSMPGQGKYKTSAEKTWILETYSDADWAGNRVHRKSTPCGIHFLNGSFLYGNARTQKVVSLSSCESELHSIVSSRSDAIFLRRCLDFLLETAVLQVHYTDSSSARQLVSRQGCGKIRHLPGKVLRVQGKVHDGEVQMVQVRHFQNVVCLRWCVKLEWFKLKPWSLWENQKVQSWLNVQQLPETWASRAKTVMRMTMLMGLGPLGRRSPAMRLNSIEPVITSGLHSFSLHTFFHGWFLVQLRFGFGGSWTEGCITTSCNRPGSATGKPQWYPKARAQGRQWPACSSRPVLHRDWRDGGHGEYSSLWTGGGRGFVRHRDHETTKNLNAGARKNQLCDPHMRQ